MSAVRDEEGTRGFVVDVHETNEQLIVSSLPSLTPEQAVDCVKIINTRMQSFFCVPPPCGNMFSLQKSN